MYRCYGCDAPAQSRCGEYCQAVQAVKKEENTPWNWEDEPVKIDINAGVRVETQQEAAIA